MSQEINGAPEQTAIRINGEQMMVICYYDLAIQMLASQENQLRIMKQDSPADQFKRVAEHLQEKRNGYVRHSQNRIQPVNGVIGGA